MNSPREGLPDLYRYVKCQIKEFWSQTENHSNQLSNLNQAFMFPFEPGSVIGDLRSSGAHQNKRPSPDPNFPGDAFPPPPPLPLKLQKQPRITYKGTVNNLVCERRGNNCNVC